jgi:hypothetical protein
VKTFLGNSTPATVPIHTLALRSLDFPLIVVIDITGREGERSLAYKGYKAKLEPLRSARLTRHDQAVNF